MASVSTAAGAVSDRIGALLLLSDVEGFGPAVIRRLVDACGDPIDALLAAARGREELHAGRRESFEKRLGGRSPAELRRLARVAATEAAGTLGSGDRMLGYGLPGYPARLERLHYPPPVLWARGPLPADAARAVAVVGTRRATRDGRALARELAAELAAAGVRIVSGLAAGVDGAAHRGALAGNGETVAVLGSGLRFRYPRVNHDVYAELEGRGLILTEFEPSVRPEPHRFPTRNRIVAALSDAVLVVEAPARSGALLTAREAGEIGIEVLACPGNPRRGASAGCNELLRDGAGLVTCAADVLSELGWPGVDPAPAAPRRTRAERAIGEAERTLLARLDLEPASLEELAALVGGVREATVLLARLEMDGRVAGLPGGRFERGGPR